MNKDYETYLVTYRHEGSDWSLELPAKSYEDAHRRLSQLSLARVDGVGIAKIPGSLGPIAALVTTARNALARLTG